MGREAGSVQGERAWCGAQKGPRVIEGARKTQRELLKLSLVVQVNIITLLSEKYSQAFQLPDFCLCGVLNFGFYNSRSKVSICIYIYITWSNLKDEI